MAGTLPTQAQMDAKLANICEQALRLDDMIAGMAQYTDALSNEDLEAAFGAPSGWGSDYKAMVGNLKAVRTAMVGAGEFAYLSLAVGPVL